MVYAVGVFSLFFHRLIYTILQASWQETTSALYLETGGGPGHGHEEDGEQRELVPHGGLA